MRRRFIHAGRLAPYVVPAAIGATGLGPLVLVGQAMWTRRRTPVLPEATGPRQGRVGVDESEPSRCAAFRLVVLGESTAVGVGVEHQYDALAPQLARVIAAHLGRPVEWRAIGRSGFNARRAARQLVPHLVGERADLLVAVTGVNDTIELNRAHRYASDLTILCEAARARLGPLPVLFTGVPILGALPCLPQPLRAFAGHRARTLDRAARVAVAAMPDAAYAPTPIEDASVCAIDGFHPDAGGYREWARRLLPWAVEVVGA